RRGPPPGSRGVTVGKLLAEAVDRLGEAGIDTPQVDAELLAGNVLGLTRTELQLELARELGEAELAEARALVERRTTREPLAYILGEWGFRRLTLTVDR